MDTTNCKNKYTWIQFSRLFELPSLYWDDIHLIILQTTNWISSILESQKLVYRHCCVGWFEIAFDIFQLNNYSTEVRGFSVIFTATSNRALIKLTQIILLIYQSYGMLAYIKRSLAVSCSIYVLTHPWMSVYESETDATHIVSRCDGSFL